MNFIVVPQESWSVSFDEIQQYLLSGLSTTNVLHHIGSTSIAGIPSKDIIDIDIECPVGTLGSVIENLALLGYEHAGDQGIPTREAFKPVAVKPLNLPKHHLYACEIDSPELQRHLAFRDYLRRHPIRAHWLAHRKMAHDEAAHSRENYIDRKDSDYKLIMAEATRYLAGN